MHILLTDILTCPRCGPEFGVILLAYRIEIRRVLAGELGCPNCRLTCPVTDGFADLRLSAGGEPPGAEGGLDAGSPDEALRLAALLGVTEGPGHVVLAGSAARFSVALAEMIEGIEVVGVDARLRGWPERPGVSRIGAGPGLPLRSQSLRAIALSGPEGESLLQEATRTVVPFGRVVINNASRVAREAVVAPELDVIFNGDGVLVAQRTP